MGLLFKPRRKPVHNSARSEASVKDLSDLLGSMCFDSDGAHTVPGSRSLRSGSPSLVLSQTLVHERFGEVVAGLRAMQESSNKRLEKARAERRKVVQVLNIEDGSGEAVGDSGNVRSASDEALMAVVICLSSCVCAHLIFDTLIGLERWGWTQGFSRTLRLSVVLYSVIRFSWVFLTLGRFVIGLLFRRRAPSTQQRFVRVPTPPPTSVQKAPVVVCTTTTASAIEPMASATLEARVCLTAPDCSPTEDCGSSWDLLEVPLETTQPPPRMTCSIRGRVRLTDSALAPLR